MSNLGGYQMLTTLAKKVGGPGKLVALIAGGGAIAGGLAVKGGEVIVKRGKKQLLNIREIFRNCKRVLKQYIPLRKRMKATRA